MLDLLEHPLTADQDIVRDLGTTRPHSKTALRHTVHDEDDGLLATAGPLMAAAYAIALGIAALTFMASREALFAVTISAGFAVMFFVLPWLMLGVRMGRDKRWVQSEAVRSAPVVATFTGRIRRSEALVQMLIVPIAVVIAFSAFGLIWTFARP